MTDKSFWHIRRQLESAIFRKLQLLSRRKKISIATCQLLAVNC
ncbi:hypothetical protein [Microcoleus sp. bin38.metabat.b11b12b14.051]|nr:hypothetical protein [Microcoleus sp. bin38.metabat.b11b12b14.051]